MSSFTKIHLDEHEIDLEDTAKLPTGDSAKLIYNVARGFAETAKRAEEQFRTVELIRRENGISDEECSERAVQDKRLLTNEAKRLIRSLCEETGVDESPVTSLFMRIVHEREVKELIF